MKLGQIRIVVMRDLGWSLMTKFKVAQKEGFINHLAKETRLIILHAGSENGWINEAGLVFQSKKATGD